LLGTFLKLAGRPNPSAISFGFARLQISAQLWGSDVPSSTGAPTFSRLLSTPYKSSKIKRLRYLSAFGMARSHHGLTIASLETPNKDVDMKDKRSRRGFPKLAGMVDVGSVAVSQDLFAQYRYPAPVSVPNPTDGVR
jgi:hypothetical protein